MSKREVYKDKWNAFYYYYKTKNKIKNIYSLEETYLFIYHLIV